MTRVLLTGAGFSRNWGGWLASEAFEYLLGCPEIDRETRQLLWRSKESGGGFEDTLADLAIAKNDEGKRRFNDLTAALVGMFNMIGLGFMRRPFEFQNNVLYMVKTFLVRFDAIFTLNQDTLLEQHYLGMLPGARWVDCRVPGVKWLDPARLSVSVTLQDKIAPKEPDPNDFIIPPTSQPYVKLHGSCNWSDGPSGGRILIMGGQKAIEINRFP